FDKRNQAREARDFGHVQCQPLGVWMTKPLAVFCFAAATVGSTPAGAQISNDIVKIGVLSDMSSLYSDSTGPGSLIAAQMAAADFNGKVKGKPIQVIVAHHHNQPDFGSTLPP